MAAATTTHTCTAWIRHLCDGSRTPGTALPTRAVEQDYVFLHPDRMCEDLRLRSRTDGTEVLVQGRDSDERLVVEFWSNVVGSGPADSAADLLEQHCADRHFGTLRRFRTRIRREITTGARYSAAVQQTYVQDGARIVDVTVTCTLGGDVLAQAWATYALPD
jgi:hypothetical protein